MKKNSLMTLFLASVSMLAAQAEDWTRFRGPEGLGAANDQNIPTSLTEKTTLWRVEIPGRGYSSPIISKGKLFTQSAGEKGDKRLMLCYDANNGKQLWSKELTGKFAKTHAKNSLASSTPTADGERVYAIFWDGAEISLSAWDYEGKQLWSNNLGKFASQHGAGLSPIVAGGKVIVNLDQDGKAELQAYDATSGKLAWSQPRKAYRACYSTPFILKKEKEEELIVASTAGVTSYNIETGSTNWNWTWTWEAKGKGKISALRNVGGPIYHNGLIYAISGDGGGDRHMVAVKSDGSGDVTKSALAWEMKTGTPYVPMPVAKDGMLFWITDKENVAYCADAATGKVHWKERLGGSGQVYTSPILVNGAIYSINENGQVFVFKAAKEFEMIDQSDLKEGVYASPAVANGKLYIRGEKTLICFGKK
ncbi:MAG: PQQ-binding-like beta-propeller repeat protein [Zavarzinella sp.]